MDKREIELAKQNILKDRRRRLLYLSPDKKTGHHIPESDMRLFSTLKNSNLIGLLVFLLIFGILGKSIILGLGLMVLIIGIAQAYLKFVFLKNKPVIKLAEQDIQKIQSVDYIKAMEANKLSQIIILVVLALMVILRAIDPVNPLVGLDSDAARLSIVVFMTYAAVLVPGYFRLRKQRSTNK